MEAMLQALKKAGGDHQAISHKDVAHLIIEGDEVLGSHLVPGLQADVQRSEPGLLQIHIQVQEQIPRPVHLCFGVLPQEGTQKIELQLFVLENAGVEVMAHCVFPNAVKVLHQMDARICIGQGGRYFYRENHFHGDGGGVQVQAKARLQLEAESQLKTLFHLVEGRVGVMDLDYESQVGEGAILEMIARMSGLASDVIQIREAAHLLGKDSRGVLETRIALRDTAQAEIINELVASAPGAWGHVDCTEILMDEAVAKAIPRVEVRHPQAKVTHEAALGSVDSKQLQTLMSRGLDEERAQEIIIQGLLNR